MTLGVYENFPQNVHVVTRCVNSISAKRLQSTLLRVLNATSGKTLRFEDIANPCMSECVVIPEFGIAETSSFNLLDNEETRKVLKAVRKKPLGVMDLFCVLRYYRMENEKRKPLRFDYHMMRVIFGRNAIELQGLHEKGPRYISPEDLVNFVVNRVNASSSRRILKGT